MCRNGVIMAPLPCRTKLMPPSPARESARVLPEPAGRLMNNHIPKPSMSRREAMRAVATSSLLLVSGGPAAARTNLTGYWVLRIPTGDGNYRETFLELKQVGQVVSGRVMLGPRTLPISDGTYADGKLHFIVTRHFDGQARQVSYNGVVEGGRISMAVERPRRGVERGIAEQTTREATLPPARLPIPQLHDVPDNGLARTPPMGWNSWNKFAGKVDDAVVRAAADAVVASGMSRAGYTYINIDDTWQGQRDAQGNIRCNRKFPDMKALADYVHSKGLKIGIYSSPGPKTCAGYEGSYGHEEQDARTYASWGFDYLKYDWCSASEIYKNDEMQAVYQKMGDALRQAGRPIVFSLCQYGLDHVWTWGANVGGNLWRTTGDISDDWKRMETIGFSQFEIAPYAKPGHWNDPDMLEVGNGGMTNDEYRTHISLWCLLAAPLLAGNDLSAMSDETKEILTNQDIIAVDQDHAAKPARRISQSGGAEVAARQLADGSTVVGLFNRTDEPQEVSVSWESVGLSGKQLHVRDLWKHEAVPANGDHHTAMVPRHGVVMLRASQL
jgi:alpha-galactosidase